MYTAISVLIFIVCILMVLIVLVQKSKGGGLSSNFSSSNQIMGVRKTTDFVEKATWTLAGIIIFLCVISTYFTPVTNVSAKSAIEEQVKNTPLNTSDTPMFPTTTTDNGSKETQTATPKEEKK